MPACLNVRCKGWLRDCRDLILVIIALILGLGFCGEIRGQSIAGAVTAETATPIAGAGHDYNDLLNETVDPASGNVSISIAPPMPKGRGITVPFQIQYNTAGVYYLDADGLYAPQWLQAGKGFWAAPGQGGWRYTVPWMTVQEYGPTADNSCDRWADFNFLGPTGEGHNLYTLTFTNGDNNNGYPCNNFPVYGGDEELNASIPAGWGGVGPVSVLDSGGTLYQFPEAPGAAQLIEDHNGNELTISTGLSLYPTTYKDSAGRTAVSLQGTGKSGTTDTLQIGGQTYQIAWTAVSVSYTVPYTFIPLQSGNPYEACPGGALPTVSGTQNEVSSITLPNGTKYLFYYGTQLDSTGSNPTNLYGLINEVIYPGGGWIRYSWTTTQGVTGYTTLASTSGNYYNGQLTSLGDQVCQYQYTTPVLTDRKASFDGTTAHALDQTFQYTTNWPGRTGPYSPTQPDWTTKTTIQTTTDSIQGGSYTKTYAYGPYILPPPAQIGTRETIAQSMPVESSVTTTNWTGNTLDVEIKGWYNQFQLACDFHEPNGNASLSSGDFYQYTASQMSDDMKYNTGQVTNPGSACPVIVTSPPSPPPNPARETKVTSWQLFTNPVASSLSAPIRFSKPLAVEVLDRSGAKIAETDYAYDLTPIQAGTFVNHDDINYPSSSAANRGNPSTITKLCLQSCSAIPTTVTYDLAGQPVSVKDSLTNATLYSYADNYTDTPPSQATDAYLTTITYPTVNGVTQHQYYKYRYSDGQLSFSQDDNDLAAGPNVGASYQYNDALKRVTATLFPDGGEKYIGYNDAVLSPSITTCTLVSAGSGGSCPVSGAPSGNWTAITTTYDGMSHQVKTQNNDPEGADITTTSYFETGLVSTQSNPYRTTGDPTYGVTKFFYDALGRKFGQLDSDGTSMQWWCYNGIPDAVGQPNCNSNKNTGAQATTWIDRQNENGSDWQQNYDAFDLISVFEPNGTTGVPSMETDYTYDALDDLTKVNQIGIPGTDTPRVRTFNYDSLSQLTQAFNPESGWVCYGTTPSNAPANGTNCTPLYDGNGNLTARTDARGIKTSYAYDALNRLTSKSYSDGTPTSAFVYNTENITIGSNHFTTSNVVGRLSVICVIIPGACQSQTAYSYDIMGRITKTLNGTPLNPTNPTVYTVSSTYDLAGNRLMLGNSTGRTFNYTYDAVGHLQTASNTATVNSLPVTTPMISSATYFASGQAKVLTTNTGTATVTGTWGVDNRLRTTSYVNLSTANSPNTNYGYSLTYTPNGNVHTTSETTYVPGVGAKSLSWTYNYDTLNRLINGISTGAILYGCAETYDSFGNRTNQAPYGGESCTTANDLVDTNNRLSVPGYNYDPAGNMLSDGTNMLTYDAEGRVVSSMQAGHPTTTYLYDANGERVSKIAGGVETDYVRDFDASLLATYVGGSYFNQPQELWVGGKHFGTVTVASGSGSQTQSFSLTNWLGSEAVRTSASTGIPSSAYLSQPFGDMQTTLFGADSDDIHFTGKERDSESGLDYFGARYYGSSMGRWLSPDWSAKVEPVPYAKLEDPQSLNLYAYVEDNPLTRFDADGHCEAGGELAFFACNGYTQLANTFFGAEQTQAMQSELASMAQQQETATGSNGVTTIHHADGSIETRKGGSAAWRNHNPGNEQSGYGAIGTAHIKINGKMHNFAIYPNDATGWNALNSNLHSLYMDKSIAATMGVFAPASDGNDPVAYANALSKAVGVPASTKLSDLSPAQLGTFEHQISVQEGFPIHGTSTILIPQ